MDKNMNNKLNGILSDEMLAEINGGIGGGIGFPYPEVNKEEAKNYIKSIAEAFGREVAIDLGMQLLGCSREEVEKLLDEE